MKALKVGVPFPSGPPKVDLLKKTVEQLEKRGVEIDCPLLTVGRGRLETPVPDYLCGSDEQRVSELTSFLERAANFDCIWFGRGGYGATRLLLHGNSESLKQSLQQARQGRLMGYSDITAIFAMLSTFNSELECIHGPILCEFADHPYPGTLLDALAGRPCPLPIQNLETAEFRGRIWGGNLAVLASLAGTPWISPPKCEAVFLEDIGEAPYRLDRYLTQLKNSGFFHHTRQIFLGTFVDCGESTDVISGLRERCKELGLKVLGELPVGHHRGNLPLFFSQNYLLDCESETLEPQGRVEVRTKRRE